MELSASAAFEHATSRNDTVFAYVVEGSIEVQSKTIKHGQCAVFGSGDFVKIATIGGTRFLFVSGEPLNEPVAWRGPIVMNTQEELDIAFEELESGTFVKMKNSFKPKEIGVTYYERT